MPIEGSGIGETDGCCCGICIGGGCTVAGALDFCVRPDGTGKSKTLLVPVCPFPVLVVLPIAAPSLDCMIVLHASSQRVRSSRGTDAQISAQLGPAAVCAVNRLWLNRTWTPAVKRAASTVTMTRVRIGLWEVREGIYLS